MKKTTLCFAVTILGFSSLPLLTAIAAETADDHAFGTLRTKWAAQVSAGAIPLPEYPRPQLVRSRPDGVPQWTNLNGNWSFALIAREAGRPGNWDGTILVPFAVEAQLSGVQRTPGPDRALWYRRTFRAPTRAGGRRCLLHFGAVDWEATVWVNGRELGTHRGGYDPFSFDITDALRLDEEQEVVVRVWDPTDAGSQPRGKQVNKPKPGTIWYTSVTGIWQTVWIEEVPATAIERIKITPRISDGTFVIATDVAGDGPAGLRVWAGARIDGKEVGSAEAAAADPVELKVRDPRLWSPGSPALYDLTVELHDGARVLDRIESYGGLREIALKRDASGQQRIALNGGFQFLLGPLDQGWWPDGLYTAPTDEALRSDIEATLAMGFNTARKHVKIEPARWYYWADRLGLLVWQDMPSAGTLNAPRDPPASGWVETEATAQFRRENAAMVDSLRNHPSVVIWTLFNEGWGQHNTNALVQWLEGYDPTRLVGGPSGWHDRGCGHLLDVHRYPGPAMPEPNRDRALVLGEYGGIGGAIPGHMWKTDGNWGYGGASASEEERRERYATLTAGLRPLIRAGLSAAIYTQTTDVEIEINGLLSYDRAVAKFPFDWLKAIHAPLFEPFTCTTPHVVLDAARAEPAMWRYMIDEPPPDWNTVAFDDTTWPQGAAPFGDTANAAAGPARTAWTGARIWLRRSFSIDEPVPGELMLFLRSHAAIEAYLNGALLHQTHGAANSYLLEPVSGLGSIPLRAGTNVLALVVENKAGSRRAPFLDVGLVQFRPQE